MSRTTTPPITYGYVDGDHTGLGYIVEYLGVSIEMIHTTAGTIQFAHGFRYPAWQLQTIQARELTAAGWPVYHDLIASQMPFDATFPQMTDAELAALRTWMFVSLPIFDAFTLKMVGRDMSIQARFASRSIRAKHVTKGINEVTVSMIRV